ncbi:MAG: hypothetical protein JF607_21200 [Burkholderiales bacterium]|jgi:hypothetical protein|nr:hypothetical protein [Burkholderiales bacterium]
MHTELVAEQHAAAFDRALCDRLSTITAVECPGSPPIRFGIKDGDGTVYRIIETTSLQAAVRLCEVLHEMGLIRSECSRIPGRPLHCAFRVSQDLSGQRQWP